MKADSIIKKNDDYLITETVLDSTVPVDRLLSVMRTQRSTGELTIAISEGGIRTVKLVERTKASQTAREKIREILGMQ